MLFTPARCVTAPTPSVRCPPMTRILLAIGLFALAASTVATPLPAAEPAKLNVLFLGDNAGHQPPARFRQLQPVLAARGITLTYTDKVADLNPATLAKYDGLMIFANHDRLVAGEREGAARLRRVRARASSRCTARATASSGRSRTSTWSGRSSAATRPAFSGSRRPRRTTR